MKINNEQYYTVKETAEMLGYFAPYVNKLIRDGKLRAIRRGRMYLISEREINVFLGLELL